MISYCSLNIDKQCDLAFCKESHEIVPAKIRGLMKGAIRNRSRGTRQCASAVVRKERHEPL